MKRNSSLSAFGPGVCAHLGYSGNDKRREAQGRGYAVLHRIDAEHDFFERVLKLEPRFIAIFGRDTENVFLLLHQARRDVEINAEAYVEEYLVEPADDQESRERRVKRPPLRLDPAPW
jgi:hypothetical protein